MFAEKSPRRGMVLGKFMPPHQGHQFLVDFARFYSDELAIVVGSLAREPIPGSLRFRWMQELFPHCQVLHLDKELPQYPHEAADFWEQWRTSLAEILPWPIDFVFASEDYGLRLAQELKADFVPLDIQRQSVPISGTAIREDPMQNWDYLPDCARPYFVKKVAVLGPESSGKSSLVKELAKHFQTTAVPEYAEILLRHQSGQLTEADMLLIARGQSALEDALSRRANRLLICDTDLLTTCLWWQELYGHIPAYLEAQAQEQSYCLTLVCAPDVSWKEDVHRLRRETRQRFFERCIQTLKSWKRPYVVIEGQGNERPQRAIQAISESLNF